MPKGFRVGEFPRRTPRLRAPLTSSGRRWMCERSPSGVSESLTPTAAARVFAIGFRRERLAAMVDGGFGLGASLRDQALPAALTEPPRASRPVRVTILRVVASLGAANSEPASDRARSRPAALLRARTFGRLRRRRRLIGASRPRKGAGSLQPVFPSRGLRHDDLDRV